MRNKMLVLIFCSMTLTACVAIKMEGAASIVDSKPTTPAPIEEQTAPTQLAPEQPTRPVATLRPHIEPVGAPGEAGERVTGEAPQGLLDAILDDAAGRTGLDRSELVIVQDEAVVWPDGSLGCPEPGMMYTMALVHGYHVIVRAGEQELDYRTGRNNFFTLCERPVPFKPIESPSS
mgnify:CR=1 FL=1